MSAIERRMIHCSASGQRLVTWDRLPWAGNEFSIIEKRTAPAA